MDGTRPRASVAAALETSEVVWLSSVRPDGAPHVVPTWFVWDGAAIVVLSKPAAQKVRNLARLPRAMVAIGDPGAYVRCRAGRGRRGACRCAVRRDAPRALREEVRASAAPGRDHRRGVRRHLQPGDPARTDPMARMGWAWLDVALGRCAVLKRRVSSIRPSAATASSCRGRPRISRAGNGSRRNKFRDPFTRWASISS